MSHHILSSHCWFPLSSGLGQQQPNTYLLEGVIGVKITGYLSGVSRADRRADGLTSWLVLGLMTILLVLLCCSRFHLYSIHLF